MDDLDSLWKNLDKDGSGFALFSEFIEWA